MSRFYAIDEANASLPEVERILAALRDQREELIALRDRVVAASPPDDEAPTADVAEQIRLLRLGMQGLIDQMQAGVARLVEMDITLRDISTGLIDYPALVSGRPIWLCWRLGEDGRRALARARRGLRLATAPERAADGARLRPPAA